MMDTDSILAISTAVSVLSCCAVVLISAICPCSCNPRRDCGRSCADCKRDRETCRTRCAQRCTRKRADTEEELVSDVI